MHARHARFSFRPRLGTAITIENAALRKVEMFGMPLFSCSFDNFNGVLLKSFLSDLQIANGIVA
jgi:hypothetical protein